MGKVAFGLALGVAAATCAVAAVMVSRRVKSKSKWRRVVGVLRELEEACDTPVRRLKQVVDAMAVEMHAGLASEGGSKLKMLLTFVDDLPNGSEKGTFYALDLGGTNYRVLRVRLRGRRSSSIVEHDVERQPIPQHLMTGTSEELFDYIASSIKEFVDKEDESKFSLARRRELGFTFSFPVKQTSVSSGLLIKWTKGFSIEDTVGKEVAGYLQAALLRKGLDMRVAALINDTVGTLALGHYHDEDTVAAVIIGTGTNACYLERTDAIIKCQGLLTSSGCMVVNMEWGSFWSSHLPRTSYDVDLDADSPNPNEQGFEKMISGMYLGRGTETSPRESVPLVIPLKHEVSGPIDPSVEVIVRIRSANEEKRQGDLKVRKLSSDTLSILEREFAFDHVFDSESKQDDIFQLVGIPLVKNALGGYNTSILSCGQTGTGKTYTMWGPPSAMVEDISPASSQGIVPRILKMLFSEIQKEHENSEKKQINYQCRCSFLEVYNEQIGDLLDPTQRNLEIRDDAKSGLYIENLTEEYLTSYEDVIQILIKGLSSRKVGATTVNSKSSRSHVMFNFIIESWSKGNSTSFGSSKTSRVSFIDLAGLDRNLKDDVDRKCSRDAKNLKKSLSRLGHLVNTLSNETRCGKAEDSLYKSSSLTRLLRDSLGGNAKLTVICAISPDKKYITETLKTLRFGQRLKCIKNIPVINEITEDDVNDLSDQIRKLKEELIRAKSSSCNSSMGSLNGYFQGQNVRESLNQLRLSLNRSLILPGMGGNDDKHVNFAEQDVKELHQQLHELNISIDSIAKRDSLEFSSAGESFETDSVSDDDDVNSPEEETDKPQNDTTESLYCVSSETVTSKSIETMIRSSLSINSGCRSPILEDPPLSESPKIGRSLRKSMAISSSLSLCHSDMSESSKLKNDESTQLQKSRAFQGPTESLAASLQRGLDIIDYHQKNSALNKSLVSFSFEHLARKTGPAAPTTDSLTFEDVNSSVNGPSSYLCASCRMRIHKTETGDIQNNSKLPLALINETVDGNGIQLDHSPEEHGQENDNTSLGGSTKKLTPPEEPQSNEKCNPVENHQVDIVTDVCEIKEEPNLENQSGFADVNEKEALLKEIQSLKSKLQSFPVCSSDVSVQKSADKMRSSLLARSIQLRKSGLDFKEISEEELEKERERWMEMESDWISLTDELRIDLESSRRRAEKLEMELRLEKMCKEELEDVIQRAVLGHARIIEHYAELQEKYNELVEKHRVVMEGIEEFKRAAEKARSKGHGSRFAKCLTAELSAVRRQREREREFLKKENKSLRIQLRDTAEAVHAAGELLARLREAEQSTLAAEENVSRVEQENEKLKKQMEKLKAKHKTEMATMKQYLADSRLPASAIQPTYREESEIVEETEEDQAWRAEFRAVYRDHY